MPQIAEWLEKLGMSEYALAYYSIKTPQGQKLTFDALIEDDGGCVNLRAPV